VKKAAYVGAALLAIGYFAFALLAVVPAPTYRLWQLSILAGEWGYWFALAGAAAAAFVWRRSRIIAAITIAGAILLFSPVLRAGLLNYHTLVMGTHGGHAQPATLMLRNGLKADLYEPAADHAQPAKHLVVVIHGGSWRGGDQTQLPTLNRYLVHHGYHVAAITYRLSPDYVFPAAVDDVRAAITFLKTATGATSIFLLGRSAGGQLALLTAYTANDPAIKGAISFYGVTDMRWGWDHPSNPNVIDTRGVLKDYLGGTPQTNGPAFDASSPVNFVGTATPTLLIHGRKDELVHVHNSRTLADRLRRAGKPVEYLEMPWATHGCDYAFNGPCGQLSTRAVMKFLERYR
jgi:acetyl esterase/lipase